MWIENRSWLINIYNTVPTALLILVFRSLFMFIHIRQWFSPPIFAEDEDKTRVAALLNTILWFFIISASLYGVFAPIEPEMMYRRAIIIIPFVVVMLALQQVVNW